MRERAVRRSNCFVNTPPCASVEAQANFTAPARLSLRARRHASPLLRRALSTSLACVSLVALLPPLASAQEVAKLTDKSKTKAAVAGETSKTAATTSADSRPRRIASLRTRETTEGARVILTSDAELNNYTTYQSGGRFFVRIPQADAGEAGALAASLRGRGFEDAQIERRGADVVLSFKLEAGASAEVRQSFNRLEVRFAAQDATQQKKDAGGGTKDPTPAQPLTAAPTPTPTPASSTPSDAPIITPATTTGSDSSNVTDTVERAKVAAGKGRTIALPPEKANPVVVPRFDTPPVIDGKLDDEIWKSARVLKDF
ncbi:MAG TPA: hypothetical protein VF634_08755, partial [Pyrinomonadaceae bacterium]